MRLLDVGYGLAAVLASPVILTNLVRTGKWRTDWRGRFGRRVPLAPDSRPTVLLHGVSVGEVNATRRIVGLLDATTDPSVRVVISASTNTGFARAAELYEPEHPVVRFPFDFSGAVTRFLDAVRPDVVALMELEVWPNLTAICVEREIPMLVVNGRLSDDSFRNYRRFRPFLRPTFERLTATAAQTPTYAERFETLGVPAERVHVTDNMKWEAVTIRDRVPGAEALAAAMGIDTSRPLVVAGSTGPGEEEGLAESRPDGVQLMLVPRKPERFEAVAASLPEAKRRSDHPDGSSTPGGDLFLLDTMGELEKAYALADVAVVGRSFYEDGGGSDPIQPFALGKPAVIGPHHRHFKDVVDALASAGALMVTDDPMEAALELLHDPDRRAWMAAAGRRVIEEHRGASERAVELILEALGS